MKRLGLKNIKIIIVDDSTIYQRIIIKEYLENELNCEIIGEASNVDEFLSLKHIYEADIILMDIQMPKLNGLEVAKSLTFDNPKAKLIAITMFSEKVYLDQLVEAGFKACLLKSDFFKQIIPALERVINGRLYFNNEFQVKQII